MSADVRPCSACRHHRLDDPPDPFVGVRLVSGKMLELRTKWQQELATQAALEEQVYLSGQGFDFRPVAYPWCEHFSRDKARDPISGAERLLYVLCVERNPDGLCTAFSASVPNE